ncbi:MAG: DUF4391 domain-containing protein [Oscillospiraceae bacterium]|nr:DUF4391 domain-containing protein [Oscillospiraceae bacterium]
MAAMLDLPKTTYIGRIIAKDKIYTHGGADSELEDLFVGQVERIRLLHNISPRTVNIAQGETVLEIQIIEISLRTSVPDKRILSTICKAIPYKIIFTLVYEGQTTYTVFYDSKTCFSSDEPPKLIGNDADSVWENFLRQISRTETAEGRTLDEQIAAGAERENLLRKIERLEKQARNEKQPRRKWDLTEDVKRLKQELEGIR